MELRRKSSGRRSGLFAIALGVLGVMAPYLLSLVGREGSWFWYFAGGITILAGCSGVYLGMRSFKIRIDEAGIFADTAEVKASLPWDVVEAVTIQRLPYADQRHTRHLIAWPVPGREPSKPNFYDRASDRKAYDIVDLGALSDSEAEVAAALQRYAGARFAGVR